MRDITGRRNIERLLQQANETLAAANEVLLGLADRDSLTRLPNGRRFEQLLGSEFGRATRQSCPVAVLLIAVIVSDVLRSPWSSRWGRVSVPYKPRRRGCAGTSGGLRSAIWRRPVCRAAAGHGPDRRHGGGGTNTRCDRRPEDRTPVRRAPGRDGQHWRSLGLAAERCRSWQTPGSCHPSAAPGQVGWRKPGSRRRNRCSRAW